MSLNLLDFIDPNQHAAIFSGAGVYADDALDEAIAYGLSLGTIPAIEFPAGRIKFACTVHLKHTVKLVGHGSGLPGTGATICEFDADQSGFVVHRHNTGPGGIEASGSAADATIIEGITIIGSGTIGHGVWMRARGTVRDVKIGGFGENGVHIVADARSTDPYAQGNANNWLLDTLRITNCGGHGVYCDLGDSNAGEGRHLDATSNGGWGIYDSSFLGNTWIACHAANSGLGPYKTDNPNARSVFLGCYSESGQPASEFAKNTLILGGLLGGGFVGGQRIGEGKLSPFVVENNNGTRQITFSLGYRDGAGLIVAAIGDHPYGWALGGWNEASGTVEFRHASLSGRVPISLTTNLTTLIDDETSAPIVPGKAVMGEAWAHIGGGRYRRIDLADMLKRIEALEQA